MSLKELGLNILETEVTNISKNGFWLLSKDKELFLPFDKFPWFRNSTIEQITDVKEVSEGHFYWEDLDIDLSVDIISNPDKFPNIYRQ